MPKRYYDYAPSFAAAVTFVILFLLTSLFHMYQMCRTRLWFWLPFIVGGFFEVIGFATRAINAHEDMYKWSFAPFVVQTLGILLAPVLFAASIYMVLGRIATLSGKESALLVKRTWLTKIFVCGDIFAFLIQVTGGVMLTSQDAKKMDRGRKIVLVGLWLQIVFFGFFIINTFTFWFRARKPTNVGPKNVATNTGATGWQKHLFALLAASLLIFGRCIYRVIEYQQGKTGYLMTHEVFVYILDGGLMLLVMLIFHFVHPSEINARMNGGKVAFLFKITSIQTTKGGYGSVHSEQGVELIDPNQQA